MACCSVRNCNSPAICCSNGNVCDKTCIETKKVFDACVQQKSISASLTVDFGGETPVSIVSIGSDGNATLSDLTITPLPGTPGSRVSFTLNVPVTVVATNQAGTLINGTASLVFDQDLIMRVPQEGLVSPTVESTVIINGLQNVLTAGNIVNTNACVTIITKVTAVVLLVVPSYGYLMLGPAQEYTQEACGSAFSTPIFPR